MIGQVCTKPAVTASPDTTAQEAAHRMRTRKVGALVIINAAGEPTGVVTDRDITVEVVARGLDPSVVRVGALVRRRLTALREDAGILDATRVMSRRGIRRLPVVSRSGRLVGVLTLDDLLILLGGELGQIASGLASGLGRRRLRAG